MAKRLSRHARSPIGSATLGLAAVLGVSLLLPAVAGAVPSQNPSDQQPTIAEVRQQLHDLSAKNSQLVDGYDQARINVHAKERAAGTAQHEARAAVWQLTQAQGRLSAGAAAMYEGGSFSATGALLSSNSGSNYLNQLDTLSMLSAHNAQIVKDVSAAQRVATAARARANDLLAAARTQLAGLDRRKTHVQKQINNYRDLLQTLTARQRAAFLAAQSRKVSTKQVSAATQSLAANPATSGGPSASNLGGQASGAAKKAVEFALAQVGKPYVWGAAGPSSYDCSGLTMAAWQAGGVSLPHSAAEQYGYGTHVSFSQMVPGDLLFFYSPIGHVAIYIGNGLMVSAPQSGENVQVIPANSFSSDYVGSTHLG